METQIAGCEIELLIIARVVGDVHFAVAANYTAVLLYDNGCVVVESSGTSLK
jgi:hypothetical protein